MNASQTTIIAVVNLKGGVGKTTTVMNLAGALSRQGYKVLAVDMDPHGNLTQGLGVHIERLGVSIRDLILDRAVSVTSAIHRVGPGLDLIGANTELAGIFRWMVTQTNTELRLRQRLAEVRGLYDFILIDSCPGLGILLNSTLNAANALIIPVDTGFYGYMGVQELFNEIEEIRIGTNAGLRILGFVLTMCDRTLITRETFDALKNRFGEMVFDTKIRRSVGLRESPAVGKNIFDYGPEGNGAVDYTALAHEVLQRMATSNVVTLPSIAAQEVGHA